METIICIGKQQPPIDIDVSCASHLVIFMILSLLRIASARSATFLTCMRQLIYVFVCICVLNRSALALSISKGMQGLAFNALTLRGVFLSVRQMYRLLAMGSLFYYPVQDCHHVCGNRDTFKCFLVWSKSFHIAGWYLVILSDVR